LPSLNDDSKVEECERNFEENDSQDIEKGEEDRTLLSVLAVVRVFESQASLLYKSPQWLPLQF
jgi:hypothetical protein